MRGIILAGGSGTRLYPATLAVSKQLLPVFDKPMIYFPLSVLLEAGVREVLVISTPRDVPAFRQLLGDGSRFGARILYAAQAAPRGIPEAFVIGRDFMGGERTVLVLGDNVFLGSGVQRFLGAAGTGSGTHICTVEVDNPEEFGVVTFDDAGMPRAIVEKPADGVSRAAIPGVYVVDASAATVAASLMPSARGELEIVDLLKHALADGTLTVHRLDAGTEWIDTGTPIALQEAARRVAEWQSRRKEPVGSPELSAVRAGLVARDAACAAARTHRSAYARLLESALARQ